MIRVCYSNRTEALVEALAHDLQAAREAGASPLDPVRLLVPNRNVETWLKHELARRTGIAANLEIHLLRRFVSELLRQHPEGARLIDGHLLLDGLLSLLLDDERLARPELARVRAWLHAAGEGADAVDLRRYQLATQLARLFEEYGYSRPEMLAGWEKGPVLGDGPFAETEVWQRQLWLDLVDPQGPLGAKLAEGWLPLPRLLEKLSSWELGDGAPVYVFGVSYVATAFHRILEKLGRSGPLHVYTLNPCMEFWEDVEANHEARRRLQKRTRRGTLEGDDPFELQSAAGDTPALALWGRPGRENVRLLNELTDSDFRAAFEDPLDEERSLLGQLQHDILVREPERTEPLGGFAEDRSLRLLACPGVKRELEVIAGEIWRLVRAPRGGEPLRFNEIAVLVAGKDPETYFTHLRQVFEETWQIPFNLSDSKLAADSRIAEAVSMLLALPQGRFSRSEILRFVTHPAVAAGVPEADVDAWARWCDELGIVHGADHRDHEGTYIERDVLNWDQGLRRLALGQFLTGERSGSLRPFELDGEKYLPEERSGSAGFGLLVRSLLADLRFVRDARLATEDWAELFATLARTYVVPRSEAASRELDRCLRAIRGIAATRLDGRKVSCRIASELVAASLGGVSATQGQYLAGGVVVSTLQPMRAIPFKAIFVAGLGEGRFPSGDRRDQLDLRLAAKRVGDVGPREGDLYMFLEALLCARERLCLSWVARDELTGDALQPSPVVVELQRMIRQGYRADGIPTESHALRRFDPRYFPSLFGEAGEDFPSSPEARREARALALRRSLERDAGGLPGIRAILEGVRPEVRQRLVEELGVCEPPAAASQRPEVIRLSLSALRRFLECPLQGSARALLRLDEEEEDRIDQDDEPFESSRLEATLVLRDRILEKIRREDGVPLEQLYAEKAELERLRGRMPLGVFGELESGKHLAVLQAWDGVFEKLVEDGRRGARIVRFGGAEENAVVDRLADPIVLQLELADGPVRVEITGRTEALVLGDTGSISFFDRKDMGKPWEQVRRQRDALRAFLDRVALSASGLVPEREHGAFVCTSFDDPAPTGEYLRFAPISRDEAVGYLETLVKDLLGQVHAYFLPVEAVLIRDLEPAPLEACIARLGLDSRSPKHSSKYGPVPHPERYPIPSDDEADEMIRRRFGLFFEKRILPAWMAAARKVVAA